MLNILISGGSDGLGKELAKRLAVENKVIILSHNIEKLQSVAKELNCEFVEADITDYSSVSKAVETVIEKYQKIDVLINNAGVWTGGSLEDNDQEKIKEVIQVNTLGTIYLTKAVIPSMKKSKSGRIINIVSQDGLSSKKDRSVYSASKWAITGFTKCLQLDLADYHIGVTGIYPGLMNTSLFEKQGVIRDLTEALSLTEVANLVKYVINLSSDTLLPEISIKNISNQTNMDNSNSSSNDLDLNPDMMTTQTGVPALATPPSTQNVSDPLQSVSSPLKGVIDITPGASNESHPPKIEDITPRENFTSDSTATSTSPVSAPVQAETPIPTGMLDITPTSEASSASSGSHLSDIVPPAITTSTTTTQTPVAYQAPDLAVTTVETPVVSTTTTQTLTPTTPTAQPIPDQATPVVESPVVSTTTTTTTTPVVEVELPKADVSPFAEDPDLVSINK